MRIRLLISAAALAAALVLPSAAFAVDRAVITTPATTPSVTNVRPVHLVWGDVPDEVGLPRVASRRRLHARISRTSRS